MKHQQWIKLFIFIPLFVIALIFSFNFVIDPYSMTSYNLLQIPNKFARDDRKEKVAKLYKDPAYANMIFGSSHVYSINPLTVQKYLGGQSYNVGVGTARIEDHLGFLLYLKRINKLPKSIIIGLDFYSFNINVETNSYFLVNDDLNFLKKTANSDLYLNKFLSLDALRASYKTLRNYLNNSIDKPRFDIYGTAGGASEVFTYYPDEIQNSLFSIEEVNKGYRDVKTIKYEIISQVRLQYIQDIISICRDYNINYTFFITPINGQLLDKINNEPVLHKTLNRFKSELSHITSYYDFLTHNEINDNRFYFGGDTQHTKTFTGNLILARILDDKKITLPKSFGLYVPKQEVRP